jgi:hypothetical protein
LGHFPNPWSIQVANFLDLPEEEKEESKELIQSIFNVD